MRRAVVLVASSCFFALCGTGSAARVRELYAWAAPYHSPVVGVSRASLHIDERSIARHVPPGRYRIHIAAQSSLAFHLVGPGVDRQSHFTLAPASPVYATWALRLRRGRYRYSGEGAYAKELRAAGVRVSGSFLVP
jgi:hypothetical protein